MMEHVAKNLPLDNKSLKTYFEGSGSGFYNDTIRKLRGFFTAKNIRVCLYCVLVNPGEFFCVSTAIYSLKSHLVHFCRLCRYGDIQVGNVLQQMFCQRQELSCLVFRNMGHDEAFRVVPGSFPQDGETRGQIGEDLLRLVFLGSIKNNALWDGTFNRPLNVLVVPKNKKINYLVFKVFIILATKTNSE